MIFVMVLVVWFYGSTGQDPQSVSKVYGAAADCLTAGHEYVAKAEKDSKVAGAQFVCVGARPVDKT